jgi:alpha-mannosidase
MQKHPDLTLNRINRTHDLLIKGRLIGGKTPVKVAFNPNPFATEAEARASKDWTPVEPGYRYGPAYRTVWFHITGEIPADWAGKEVSLLAETGGERTVWIDNSPDRGIDGPHALYRITDAAAGGEKIDLMIQAYTMNPQVRLIGDTPPREELTDTVGVSELAWTRSELVPLHYDVMFALSLLKQIPTHDPGYATILRGLNQMVNLFDPEIADTIPSARKAIRDAMGSINNELKHQTFAVGHAHLDTAWLWPIEITKKKMAHTTANQLYLMERYPNYVFVHTQASQYEWLEKEYPELFKRVANAVDGGQWEILGSMWVEADCNVTGGESLIRQFLYGKAYFREKFGVETQDMWLPDVFGYAAALPQILSKMNIKYFLTQKISWNQTNKFPHNTFWWRGIDGTRIWSHFPPADTYVGDGTPREVIEAVRKHKDQGRSDVSLYVFGHGDGGGGPTEEHIELLARGKTAPYMPEIELNKQAVDFYREAKSKSKDLMTWSGELYLEMHRGTYTSQANNKKWNRQSEFLLRDVELLKCFTSDFPSKYPQGRIEDLWKLVLLNQFHDIIPGSSVREVYVDSDADYAEILSGSHALIEDSLQQIGKNLVTPTMEMPVALFANATMATQSSVSFEGNNPPQSLVVGDTVSPVQHITEFGESKLIFETPVEALEAVAVGDFRSTAAPIRGRLKARDRKLENDEWAVRLDGNGNIVSISSLDDRGIEFIEPGKLANVFQMFDDRPNFWGAWDIDPWIYEKGQTFLKAESVEIVEKGPVRVALEIVRKISEQSWIRQRISLGPTPGIRFDTEIEWREAHKLLKVAFPLNINAPAATYEIQFGHVQRPTHMNTSWDAARFEVPAHKWVDVSQGDLGMALLNDAKYGFDCDQNVLRMSLLRAPKAPDPECDMGRHRFSYVLMPHFHSIPQSDIVAAAYALNAPTRSSMLQPGEGVAASLPKFISVDSRHVIIESVKKAERSNHIIVRLYECHNTRGTAFLSCARHIKSAWLADMEENPLSPIELAEEFVPIRFAPFEIITIMLEV